MATLRTNSKEFMNRFAAYFMETMEARIDDHNEYVEHKDYDITLTTRKCGRIFKKELVSGCEDYLSESTTQLMALLELQIF